MIYKEHKIEKKNRAWVTLPAQNYNAHASWFYSTFKMDKFYGVKATQTAPYVIKRHFTKNYFWLLFSQKPQAKIANASKGDQKGTELLQI